MLTLWPIKSINQQMRRGGYKTDDFVVTVATPDGSQTLRLLVQVKHGIAFTNSNKEFRQTIADAWSDFSDSSLFTRGKDAIAIVTGPLSATDIEDTRVILEWARELASAQEYFQNVGLTNFSSNGKRTKLAAFRAQIDLAAGSKVNEEDVFAFLRHLHILSMI